MITKYPRQEASQNQTNTTREPTKKVEVINPNPTIKAPEMKIISPIESCKNVEGGTGKWSIEKGYCEVSCRVGATYDQSTNKCVCSAGETTDGSGECIYNAYGTMGIQCSPEQMKTGSCSRNINQTLGLDKSRPNPTVFVQDLILAATSFVGTVMVIALIIMGWKYIQGGFEESSSGDLKKNIMKLLIGLGLIVGSYTIIRVIQYIAMGM